MEDCHSQKSPEVADCCHPEPAEETPPSSCCGGAEARPAAKSSCCGSSPRRRIDWLLWGSVALVAIGLAGHLFAIDGPSWWHTYAHGTAEFMAKAWWGIVA